MKKFILLFFFICSIVAAQVPIIPFLWQVNETTGEMTPTVKSWYLNVSNTKQIKKLNSSTVNKIPAWATTSGDSLSDGYTLGTAANNIVQLDGSGKLPAVDGSQLTSLPEFILDLKKITTNFTTSSTSYVDITGLSDTLIANTTYLISGFLIFSEFSTAGRISFSVPTGSYIYYSTIYEEGGTIYFNVIERTNTIPVPILTVNATTQKAYFNVVLEVQGTGGLFKIQTKSDSGTGVTIYAGANFSKQRTR